jgi:hypothetical protein
VRINARRKEKEMRNEAEKDLIGSLLFYYGFFLLE